MQRKRLTLALLAFLFACGARQGPDAVSSRTQTLAGGNQLPGSPVGCPEPLPVYRDGNRSGLVCPSEATSQGLTVVDLSDDWAPRMFAPDDPYRSVYARLADRQPVSGEAGDHDRFLATYGVLPTPHTVGQALLDDTRHRCHDDVDDDPLGVSAVKTHLQCDGLLPRGPVDSSMDRPTREALHAWQRRNFLLADGELDRATHDLMQAGSEERDFQALLRTLRERVVDATALLEDGSAANARGTVFGRYLDPPAIREPSRPPMPNAAPDLISPATEAAAEALGWTDPDAAAEFFRAMPEEALRELRVAVPLPPAPDYHAEHMELRLEIDRGDVWYEPPFGPDGEERDHPVEQLPAFVVYARDGVREIPLMRWKTTIGGWRREVGEDGEIGLRYKDSPTGPRTVRHMVVAPAWLPPQATPDDELMRQRPDGTWEANRPLMDRGWGSAFGMVMFKHEKSDGDRLLDEGIRTHGTAQVQSVLGGYSHGCHRLLSHLATRLAGFVLAHRDHAAEGLEEVVYERRLEHEGDVDTIVLRERGYVYELDPPLTIDVLPGRIRGELQEPPEGLVEPPTAR